MSFKIYTLAIMTMMVLVIVATCFAIERQIKLDATKIKLTAVVELCQLKESIIQTMLSPPDVLPIESVGVIEIKRLPAGLLRKNK